MGRSPSRGQFLAVCVGVTERRRQHRYGTGRISIDERLDLVAARERFGDWEGDIVEGAKGSGHIIPHVERKSRYLIAAKLANKAAAVRAAAIPRCIQANTQNVTTHADAG